MVGKEVISGGDGGEGARRFSDVFVGLAVLTWTMASEFVARASMVSTLALARRWVCRVPRRSDDCFVRSVLGSWEAWDRVVACWRRVVVGVGVDLLAAIVTLFLIVCSQTAP